ncbi:hypothetical protein AKJ09_09050 [Labilithrix luteola]|uniref:Uncharacterized protein n=1 Tax=Labilithrix luteola TaxID=1391654 RepID=A0A0K1Q9P7_9BACT|nr:hypothetical protein [Labilithrix luteola]AKV02387.1 hypothetical protein AKJ09_09050 [Labilithrix luteola]
MSMDLSFLLFLRPMPRAATPPENPKPEGGELERAGEVEEAEEGAADDRAPAERIKERGAEETDDDRIDTRLLRER